LLDALLDHLWSPACAAEVQARQDSDVEMCALADAVGVAMHATYAYILRPPALSDYNERVLAAARLPVVALAAAAPPRGARLSPEEEQHMLAARLDGDLERFRGAFVRAVMGTV